MSHSRRDTGIVNLFKNSFNNKIHPIFYEYEMCEKNPPYMDIRDKISQSKALFVLMGPHLNCSEYTSHWISYEVGVADGFGKTIWVFEDVNNKIFFPIPHVNHYVIYDSTKDESLSYLQRIINCSALDLNEFSSDCQQQVIENHMPATFSSNIGFNNVSNELTGVKLVCPYKDCSVDFRFYGQSNLLHCPSCRRSMKKQSQVIFQEMQSSIKTPLLQWRNV